MGKRFLMVALTSLMAISAYAGKGVTFKFRYENMNNKKIALITKSGMNEALLDDQFSAEIKLKEVETGYVTLRFGNTQMKIYMQEGCDLSVDFVKREGISRPVPQFEGKVAAENDFLCTSNGYVRAKMVGCTSPQDVMNAIDFAVEKNIKTVDSKPFSKDFIKLERERVRYETLSGYNTYSKWDPSLFPYLKKNMANNENLLEIDEYKKFMKEAISTRGFENMPTFNAYTHAQAQLAIVVEEFQKGKVAEYLVVTALSEYLTRRGVESMDKFDAISKKIVKSKEFQQPYNELYSKWAKVSKGQPCPDFKYEDIDGKIVTPQDFKGKYVFIDCWATWCGPCLQQLKPLQELEHHFASCDIVFLSISCDDDKAKWQKMVKSKNMGGVQVIQNNSSFNEAFMINGIPRFILLDKEGNVYDPNMSRPSDAETRTKLESLLLVSKKKLNSQHNAQISSKLRRLFNQGA